MTPHCHLPCFLPVLIFQQWHHAFLYPGVISCKSSVHIWDSPSAVCWDLTLCCNLTPLPSFHISNPQRNNQRAPTQAADYKRSVAKLVQCRWQRGREDRVWRRFERFSDGSARCKITPSRRKVLSGSYLLSCDEYHEMYLHVWKMFAC